jgi:sugar phosphate isomerase/epimerase
MNKLLKYTIPLIVMLMMSTVFPVGAFSANDAEKGVTLSISTSADGGGLKDAVDAAGVGYEQIRTLIITDGILNIKDCKFINENLKNLVTLEVVGTANFTDSTVPSSAFSGNTSLENVIIANATAVNQRAFYESNVVYVDLPEVTAISSLVFVNCKNLVSVNLPKLTSMDNRAFYGSSSLTSLTLGEQPPELLGAGNWFKDVNQLTVYVPTENAIDKYLDDYEFSEFRIRVIGESYDDEEEGGRNSESPLGGYTDGGHAVISRTGDYYTGDYKVSLNLYSFNLNLNAWMKNNAKGAPPIDTLQAIRFAKEAGFDAVDITAYYIPGYENRSMPTKPDEEILQYAREIRALCDELGIEISGTGVQNDFAVPDDEKRTLDVERVKYWIDIAAEMGAPVIRVFSGNIPRDINRLGWETIARERIVPALRELAEYGAAKGVKVGLQNHGDMTSTADQIIRIVKWVDHPNLGIVNDTGYFRNFGSDTGMGYDWYADIEAALPYSNNIQVKKKPAGQETDTPIDLEKLFTAVRYSDYRGYITIELLWKAGDPGYPKDLPEPPYEEIREFLAKVKTALEYTKTNGPSSLEESPSSGTDATSRGNKTYEQVLRITKAQQDKVPGQDKGVTRAEFVAMVAQAFRLPSSDQTGFDDVTFHWARDYIAAAHAKGIISGTGDGAFNPNALLTRQEMAIIIANALSLKPEIGNSGFADDGKIAEWALPYVRAVTDKGIVTVKAGSRFDPDGTVTKAEAAAVILRAIDH